MTVIAYNDPDIGTRCVRCTLRVYGVVGADGANMSMPDPLVARSGFRIYPTTEDSEWWNGTSYREVLWCDDCGCEIAESPENEDYCSCNDGCEQGCCSSCEAEEEPDDGDYENERGCRCDGCCAMRDWVPGDPEPLPEGEPPILYPGSGITQAEMDALPEEPPVRDGNPVPVFASLPVFASFPFVAEDPEFTTFAPPDPFYDPAISPGIEYDPGDNVTWAEASVGQGECDSRSYRSWSEGGRGWYCERVHGHPLPHGAFRNRSRGPMGTRCWN